MSLEWCPSIRWDALLVAKVVKLGCVGGLSGVGLDIYKQSLSSGDILASGGDIYRGNGNFVQGRGRGVLSSLAAGLSLTLRSATLYTTGGEECWRREGGRKRRE